MTWSGILVISLSLVPGVILQTAQYEDVLISEGKPVNMTSILNYFYLWEAKMAVDGNITNHEDPNGCRCCAGTKEDPNQMFTLNLEEPYNISRIKIYGRADGSSIGDLRGFAVYLSTSARIQDGVVVHTITTTALDNFTVNIQEKYQYVIVRSDGDKVIVICEIQVYTQVCRDGYYDDCIKKCGQCKDDAVCNTTTGKCPNGCKPGFQEDQCSTPCDDYFYGDCQTPCGNCNSTDICNKTSGHCPNGCAAGYHQSLCTTECQDGQHGEDCLEKCGNCKDSEICNKTTGACSACAPGYTGDICKTPCDWGKYGDRCLSTCGICLGNATCNISTGFCDQGCGAGYTDMYCNTVCDHPTFGQDCSRTCNCKDGGVCDSFTGQCDSNLCEPGWKGSSCDIAQIVDTVKSDNTGVIVGVIAGVVPAVVLIAAIIVIFCVGKHQRRKGTKDRLEAFVPLGAISYGSSYLGSSVAQTVSTKDIVAEGEDTDEGEDDGGQVYINMQDLNIGVKAYELWNYIKRKLLEKGVEFVNEYKSVPKKTDESTSDASLPKNRGKNRYREMHPYNYNRVHLDTTDGAGGDYINASFINGVELQKKFIASQGPQKYMVDDFWRMVWQQKAKKIVMLTNIYEKSIKKIVCYWSEEEDLVYGRLTIKVLNTLRTDDYTIRNMILTHENGGTHTITQYHYKAWPDKDVPSTAWSLVNFWRKVNETPLSKQAGPIIVHCSAGVGRTGTYIALDCLYNEAMMSDVIRPLKTLQTLREQRVLMIQTKAQYVFLHEAIAEALYFGTHHVLQTQFDDVYQYMMGRDEKSQKSRLELQFEMITKSLDLPFPEEADNQYGNVTSAQAEINVYRPRSKNRNSKNIQELDALYLPTYNNGKGFIMCKNPSEMLIAGFWNLVDEENVKTIIMLSDKTTKEKVPANLGASSSALEGCYVVTCQSEDNTGWCVERTYTLKEANTLHSSESSVRLIECIGWKDGETVPGDIPSMVTMLETVIQWHPHPSEAQPILVCCGNGVEKSGLLCVLINEMYRMRKNNGRINIVESLKKMKHRQPNIITGFPQYKYCYDVIQEVCRQDLDVTPVKDTSSENEHLYQNLHYGK